MEEKTVYDWGQAPTLAPSIKRVNPMGWVAASMVMGLLLAFVALAILWRPMLGVDQPPGSLTEHIGFWAKGLVHMLFRPAFVEEARFYSNALRSWDPSQHNQLIWRSAVAAWLFLMPWVFLAAPFLRPRDGLIHLRGSTRLVGQEAIDHLNLVLKKRVERRPDHEIAPGIAYPADLWTRHVLVVGGTGSGKSTAIKPLIEKIASSGEQMLLFDPKSEFTENFGQPEIIAPWDSRSLAWDIARDMRNPLDMRRFAATMIRESQDPMWSNASRQLLVGLMIYLQATRGYEWGWLELSEMVAQPQAQLLAIMKVWHPEAVRSVEKASVTTSGILINLASFCSAIFDLAEAWGTVPKDRRISFVEWSQGKSKFRQVIMQGHGAYAELTKSYAEGIVGIFSAMVNSVEMRDNPNNKIWFIADEFAQLGKVPVRPLFEVGRSRGVRCVVACQDFAQLEEIYGAPMVKALIGMSGTMLIGQIMQGETAEQLCKAFGAREVERANMSASSGGGTGPNRSTTLSYNRDEVALYKPSELSSRLGMTPDGTGMTLLLFTGGQAFELIWPMYSGKFARNGHEPAPWTLGKAHLAAAAKRDATANGGNEEAHPIPSGTERDDREVDSTVEICSSEEYEAIVGMVGSEARSVATQFQRNPNDSCTDTDTDVGMVGPPEKRLTANEFERGKEDSETIGEEGAREADVAGEHSAEQDPHRLPIETPFKLPLHTFALSELKMAEKPAFSLDARAVDHDAAPVSTNGSPDTLGHQEGPLFESAVDLAMHKAGLEALSNVLALMGAASEIPQSSASPKQEVIPVIAAPQSLPTREEKLQQPPPGRATRR